MNSCLLLIAFISIRFLNLTFVLTTFDYNLNELTLIMVTILRHASDLASFGFFYRSSVEQFMKFTSKMMVERSELASRCSVKEGDYLCHMYTRSDRLACVLVSDHEYPHRVAHTLITRILDEFASSVPAIKWRTDEENSVAFPQLNVHLAKYQNPNEADAITKLQNELDETKIVLHNTISSLLQRGEKLDDLVAKSEELSTNAKVFYKTARKSNQCCQLL